MKNLMMAVLLLLLTACSQAEKKKRIAILTPASHVSLEKVEKGFIETLEKGSLVYEFVTYNAQGNKTLLRSEVEEISKSNFDLLLTIGTSTTQIATEVFLKKGIATPIVFTAVNMTEDFSGNNVTGVKEILKLSEEINAFISLKPNLSKLLLVYNPAEPGLKKDHEEISDILKDKNISLQVVEVFQTNEIKSKVSPFMDGMDALLILRDNTVVSGVEILSKLCNEKQILLMASDLNSPDRGAAFGFGVYEYNFGVEAALKAILILEKGINPKEIPVTPVSNFQLHINKKAAAKQGFRVQP